MPTPAAATQSCCSRSSKADGVWPGDSDEGGGSRGEGQPMRGIRPGGGAADVRHSERGRGN
eukprot:355846-Chlamydomonas_euryale.AAC.1